MFTGITAGRAAARVAHYPLVVSGRCYQCAAGIVLKSGAQSTNDNENNPKRTNLAAKIAQITESTSLVSLLYQV